MNYYGKYTPQLRGTGLSEGSRRRIQGIVSGLKLGIGAVFRR